MGIQLLAPSNPGEMYPHKLRIKCSCFCPLSSLSALWPSPLLYTIISRDPEEFPLSHLSFSWHFIHSQELGMRVHCTLHQLSTHTFQWILNEARTFFWCRVDVSPTEISWMWPPLNKASLGYYDPDRCVPTLERVMHGSHKAGSTAYIRLPIRYRRNWPDLT